MRDMRIGMAAGTMALALALGGCGHSGQMACPSLKSGQPGDIQETPAQLQTTRVELGSGSENEIGSVIPRVQARHPQAGPDTIANYLVVAYCPTIAARDGAADEKTRALAAFAERARRIATTMPHP